LFAAVSLNAQQTASATETESTDAKTAPSATQKVTVKTVETKTTDASSDGEVVKLSPFEVVADTHGYYSTNSMSGTRFNTNLKDLGSSITVMTKEQMSDFAMLDINDVFLYTANAEGTGTYTDYTVDRNGQLTDNVQMNPTQANRMRGISSANMSYGNYEVSGRMPIDPLLIEGIEISRGPNANVFGLGNASGTVNQVPMSANLSKNSLRTEIRADSYEGYRTTLDVNRMLVRGKLSVRVNGAFQHDGFVRKPSGVNTVRYNGFLKYRPFKNTTISGGVLFYRMNGNRPNYTPPRDYVTDWINAGKPSWDPVLQYVTLNGTSYRFTSDSATVSGYTLNNFCISRAGTIQTRANLYVDQTGVAYWTTPSTNNMAVTTPTPTTNSQTIRLMQSSVNLGTASASPGRYTNQPLWTTTPTVSDKSIYDWSSINISSVNRLMDRTIVYQAQLDQIIVDTPRHMLAFQAGFFREDNQRYQRTHLGNSGMSGQSGQLFVDVNTKRLDGSTNPFFGQTYLAAGEPLTKWIPSKWDTYRAQLAYRLDLSREKGWLKWLGVQQFSAYDEYKYRITRQYSFREALTSTHSWTSAYVTNAMARGNQSGVTGAAAGPNVLRQYIRYYVGGNSNGHVDYAPHTFDYGDYAFVWGGYTVSSSIPTNSGTWIRDPASLGLVATTDSTGGTNNTKQIIKTPGAVLQSFWFDGKLVTVAGYRQDKVYSKNGLTPALLDGNCNHDYVTDNGWALGDYRYNVGRTKTLSLVARPFRDIKMINQKADAGGVLGFVADMARNISFTFSSSENFVPQAPAVDLYLNQLPNTTGRGKDWGFWLPLANDRFVLRFNRYTTKQFNARDSDANTVAQRVLRKDILYSSSPDAWNLPYLITNTWYPTLTGDTLAAKIAEITQIPTATANKLAEAFSAGTLAATNDITAKGTEIELNYNPPSRLWTIAANATQTEAISSNISSAIQKWIDQRTPVWTTVVDPTTSKLWWTSTYGSSTPYANHLTFVQAPYAVIKQQEGKSKPSVRKYAFKVSGSMKLALVSDNKYIKRFKVGGAARWEDKGAIGYYGKNYASLLASGSQITELDADNPVWDKAHWYFDAFVGYQTKLWGNRILANFQLNVKNIQEGGRLQAIGAFPDGTANAFRIVDPRQFILSASFDM